MANLLQSGVASAERVFQLLDAEEQEPDAGASRRCPPTGRGRVEFEHVSFRYEAGPAADRGPVAGRRARPHGRDRRARPARARPRWSTWSCGSTSWTAAGSPWTASTSPRCAARSCGRRSAWCCRTPGCSAARSATTSPTARRTPPRSRSTRPREATFVDRFVRSLPDGYDTLINEEASNVSVGEKQLITIARAFLAEPSLLILDEATSSVDTRTELLVQRAMARAAGRPDQLRHRPPALHDPRRRPDPGHGGRPDRRVRARTTSCSPPAGAYYRLYNTQFRGPVPDAEERPSAERLDAVDGSRPGLTGRRRRDDRAAEPQAAPRLDAEGRQPAVAAPRVSGSRRLGRGTTDPG